VGGGSGGSSRGDCCQQLGSTPVQARGILQRPEEQSRTGSRQGSSVAGQPQCPRLWHRSTPHARSILHSPSAPPPSFTQSPYPPRSLVRYEQTHPHRPRLVVSHSTCPPLSSSPHANSFVIGPAVIKHTHTLLHWIPPRYGPGAGSVGRRGGYRGRRLVMALLKVQCILQQPTQNDHRVSVVLPYDGERLTFCGIDGIRRWPSGN
jgi:hypothetical protein